MTTVEIDGDRFLIDGHAPSKSLLQGRSRMLPILAGGHSTKRTSTVDSSRFFLCDIYQRTIVAIIRAFTHCLRSDLVRFTVASLLLAPALVHAQTTISPAGVFSGEGDIDDMAVWVHPSNPAESLIIGADKGGNRLYVWDIDTGTTLQTIPTGMPGNIDVRYDFPLNGGTDIVGFNVREADRRIELYAVDRSTRRLSRIDDGAIRALGETYGFCLGVDRTASPPAFYAFKTAEDGRIEQFRLAANGTKIGGMLVRTMQQGKTEGCVADDANGYVYIGEEDGVVYRYDMDPSTGAARINVENASNNLESDVEGQTIYYTSGLKRYLILSSQGAGRFDVVEYSGAGPYAYRGAFTIAGVDETDGIDVSNRNLGPAFPQGIFLVHNGQDSSALTAVRWQDIASALGLAIDTSFDPRVPAHGGTTGSGTTTGGTTGGTTGMTGTASGGP
jgi:3-phytase